LTVAEGVQEWADDIGLRGREAHPKHVIGGSVRPAGVGEALLQPDQGASYILQEDLPGLGQLDPAPVALEQRDPQLVLELGDLPAESGLGDVEALGRPPEVELLGDGDEVAQVA
jgi:hypothetical protein